MENTGNEPKEKGRFMQGWGFILLIFTGFTAVVIALKFLIG
jgi:hypothetical protein